MSDITIPRSLENLTKLEIMALQKDGYIDVDGNLTEKGIAAQAERAPAAPALPVGNVVPSITAAPPELEKAVNELITDEAKPESQESVGITRRFCPNCKWDLNVDVTDSFSEEDKHNFIRHILGGGDVRFSKTYGILGDRIKVTFRSRKLNEAELIFAVIDSAAQDNKNVSVVEMGVVCGQYQLIASLAEIKRGDNQEIFPTLESETSDLKQEDAIALLKKLHKERILVHSEGVYNLIVDKFKQFELLYATLQTRAADPNF